MSGVRVTICELPHVPQEFETAWRALCRHVEEERSDLVLLPELAMVEPLWERASFDPARWAEFQRRYDAELDAAPDAWAPLVAAARQGSVTLLYSARDTEHNAALALRDYLERALAAGAS